MTIVGENEIGHLENLIGPFLVHKNLSPRPPPPLLMVAPPPPLECSWGQGTAQHAPGPSIHQAPRGSSGSVQCHLCPSGSVKERHRPQVRATPRAPPRGFIVEEAAGQPTHGLPQRPQCRAPLPRDASERKRPHGRPQKRLRRRLERLSKRLGAVTVGYKCH